MRDPQSLGDLVLLPAFPNIGQRVLDSLSAPHAFFQRMQRQLDLVRHIISPSAAIQPTWISFFSAASLRPTFWRASNSLAFLEPLL